MNHATANAETILQELVGIASPSSISNAALIETAAVRLERCGWRAERLPYRAASGVEQVNLLAFPKRFAEAMPEVELLFCCHTDTVPFRAEWSGALHLEQRTEYLHGCGSCDVKGSLAGLLAAIEMTDPHEYRASVALALTAEEEIGCLGATRLVALGAVRPRRAVICEPTSLRPATSGKGYGLAEVVVAGREAHSAFPGRGVSAIAVAAHLISAIGSRLPDDTEARNPLFDPPQTTFNVGVLQGGTAKNIVAGECRFLVEWRPIPDEPARSGGEALERLAQEIAAAHPGCRIEVHLTRADTGFVNGPESRLGVALSRLLRREPTGISFGSEATRFAGIAEEVVVLGPGDMETAHSERECVPIAELMEWTEAVRHLLLHGISA